MLVSCSNNSNWDVSNAAVSQMQDSISNTPNESSSREPLEIPSEQLVQENIIQSSNDKVCYNLTKQIGVDKFTIVNVSFINNSTLIIIHKDVNDTQNQCYFLTLYDVKHLKILKTLTIKMSTGNRNTSCGLGDDSIRALDLNKGCLSLYDYTLNPIREIMLPSGYSGNKIALSKDNKKVAYITNEKRSLEVYDVDNNQLIYSLDRIQLPQYDSDIFCTDVAFLDSSKILLNLVTQKHELCMAIFNIGTGDLNYIIDGNMKLSQSREDYYFKNDITGSFNSLMSSKCDTFKVINTDGKQEAQYVPVPEQYNQAEDICFSRISSNKLLVDFSDDYSKINLSMINSDDTVKYKILLENRDDEFEPVNLQSDNIFSEDGESIAMITSGRSLYLIKDKNN